MFDVAGHLEAMTDDEIARAIERAKEAGGPVVAVTLTIACAGGPAMARRRAVALVRKFQAGATLTPAERQAYRLLEKLAAEFAPKKVGR